MKLNSPDQISNGQPHVFEFAEFSFDAAKKLLWRDGETVQLAPKACELLAVLIESAPQVLSKEELMNRVWSDTFVEEANLTHHISALRKALGEDKNGRKFIETIPRKGYRFVAEVKNASSFERAEITFNERAIMQVVEETTVETNDLPVSAKIKTPDVVPIAAPPLPKNPRRPVRALAAAGVLLIGTAAFFGWLWLAASPNKPAVTPQTITFKRLTPDIFALGGTISPDGKTVAFNLIENGSEAIWRKIVATGETAQLTPKHLSSESYCVQLRYSPDGQWLYFGCMETEGSQSSINGYRIPAQGGVPQKIIVNVRSDYTFSPDSKQVAFVRGERMLVTANADGSGGERVVAECDGKKRYFNTFLSGPGWSPDGRHLVISVINLDSGKEISELTDIDLQTNEERIIVSSADFGFGQIQWLADNSGLIVTTRADEGLPRRISHVSYPDGKITPLTNETNDYSVISLTKDSRTMVAHQNLGQANLWTAAANDLSRRKQITIGASARHGTQGLAFMPDGKIIYTSTQTGNLDLWEINPDGSGQRQLTNNSGTLNAAPQVTPDGRYIVFISNRSGSRQIWRMDAGGGNPVQLSIGKESWNSRLSPDGKWVYYLTTDNGQDNRAYRVSIEGGEAVSFDNRYYTAVPNFSPDGKRLLFKGREKEGASLYSDLTDTSSGARIKIPEAVSGEWLPDSKSVVFLKADAEMWKLDVAANKTVKIADFNPTIVSSFAVSFDGRNYVFALGNFTSEAVLIENFWNGGELKK